jgi:methionyl-tRNA formyltransferase
MKNSVLVLGDNRCLLQRVKELFSQEKYKTVAFTYATSPVAKFSGEVDGVGIVDVQQDVDFILADFDLVLSLHCQQIFPKKLVESIRCVNVHPGYNPHNRGWYPHVFSIINKLPCGATIHEMDEFIDRGRIIVQKKIDILSYENSADVYEKITNLEVELIDDHILNIINGDYSCSDCSSGGNYNSKGCYERLCEIDLKENGTFSDFIDRLRALSYEDFRNAYFWDGDEKVFLTLQLTREIDVAE